MQACDVQERVFVRVLVTDSHRSGGHGHETHGHKPASESVEKREEGGKAKARGSTFVYKWHPFFSAFAMMTVAF